MATLSLENVSYIYSPKTPFEIRALDNVSLTVREGSVTGIIGHTGSGKSTLVQLLNGLERPTMGRVLLDGKDIWENPREISKVRFRVGLVMQYPEYQLKLCAILDKLENGLNYFETVRKHWNLSTTAEANKYANRLKLWERKYLEGGLQGLMEERRGRACGPGKGRPRKKPRPPEEENPLVAENRRLRMEIEYLKKLSALVLANERARKNKRK